MDEQPNGHGGATAKPAETTAAKDGPWLNAWFDPVAGMASFSQLMCLADLHADGDNRLVMVDANKRIRIYKGTSMQWQQKILEVPTAVQCIYHEVASPAIPTVAVAAGDSVYIYRYLRPYLKFTLPPCDIDPQEKEVWTELGKGADARQCIERLAELREQRVVLTNRSVDLLALEDLDTQLEFIRDRVSKPFQQQTAITCMETLKLNMDDPTAVSLMVLGTENRKIFVLDSQGMRVVKKIELEATPSFMHIMGKYEVDYRITVACRDGKIYTVKNGQVLSTVLELETQPVGLKRIDKSIFVACMDQQLHSYHVKGKKNFSMQMPHPISCIEVLHVSRATVARALIVCLQTGEVRVYNGKNLFHTFSVNEPIMGCKFGTFGREEGSLVISLKNGGLVVKILNRGADLEVKNGAEGRAPEQDIPLDVPKKTKLYVEQTTREKENAIDMHRIFQRDLCKVRLSTARAYVKLIGSGHGPMSYGGGAHLRLNAEVRGMGPEFQLLVKVQNTGMNALFDLPLVVTTNHKLYDVKDPCRTLACVVPNQMYHLSIDVVCKDENGGTDSVYLYMCNPQSSIPMITAIVAMPFCEPLPAEVA